MADRLVYIATGRDDVLVQAEYAVQSAVAWAEGSDLQIEVHTDRPDAFRRVRDARVRAVAVCPETFRRWHGRWNFFFRVKPALLRDVLQRHPGDGVMLVDADTYFTGPVREAFARIDGAVVMHAPEYRLCDSEQTHMRNFCRRMRRARHRGDRISDELMMWNSGAVGMRSEHLPIIDEWLELIDAVYPHNPRPWVEQYGLSVLLQRDGRAITATDDLLAHYWDDKPRHVDLLRERLERMARVEPAEAARLARERIVMDGPPPREPKPPRLVRLRRSIRTRVDILRGLLCGG
jgi:hypothetical protein